ncbi:MAG: type II toxin-antitoxin system prevent-host-death family antitoxin [Defluviitaleaceae bacterium]|nr:type II toxin-antitoxin system prevent-host-death family antitoxin [Defluviitaleaceae bacterium]MCL2239560.1 type II toxin-antitoxin system prevent-host-death family antitoxin [Defluviitaleaceae bacterium]
MLQVNIHEAKTHLSALVEKVAFGESFIIAKAGKPMAKVIPYTLPQKPRGGFLNKKMNIPENFDTLFSNEIVDMFCKEGEGE